MPNHASNILILSGPSAAVLYFVDKVSVGTKNNFDFNTVLPIPEELTNTVSPVRIMAQEELDIETDKRNQLSEKEREFFGPVHGMLKSTSDMLIEKYGHNNWYDWKLANWGTKWGAYDVGEWDVVSGKNGQSVATVFYNTAWSPASVFLLNASKQFTDLAFKHVYSDEEGGGGFVGTETFENGELTHDYQPDWESDDGISFRDQLGTNSFEEEYDDQYELFEDSEKKD